MTNYSNYSYSAPKSKKGKYKKYVFCLFILGFLVLYLVYYVNPKVLDSSEAQIRSLSISEINKGIKEVTKNQSIYDNLINITYNSAGDVSMISSNSYQINLLSTNIIEVCQEKLNALGEQGIYIRLGNFSGLAFLSGLGPNVKIKMKPIGATHAFLSSNFTSQGINQTLHELFLRVSCQIKVILPIRTLTINVENEVLIAESVIVGKIPDTYLSANKIFSLY